MFQKRKRKKKYTIWLKALLVFNIVLISLVLCAYLFINSKLNKIQRPKEFVVIPPEEEYFEVDEDIDETINEDRLTIIEQDQEVTTKQETDYLDIVWPSDGTLLTDKQVINILLIGQDRREGELRARSDTMMIATLNKKNDTIKLTSIMRDLYVQIPGYSDNRINAAYSFGGMELLDATIDKNLQISIEGNIEVDFNGFKAAVNQIGGVYVDINASEAAFLTKQGYGELSEGTVYMDGAIALTYARIRNIGNSDRERTERQRKVMTALFDKVKKLDLNDILELTNHILPYVTTDLTNNQIISLATTIAFMDIERVGTYCIPVKGAYEPKMIRGMSVLVPDLVMNRVALKDIIYKE